MVAGTSSVRLEGHIRPHVVIPEYHSAAERGTVVGKSMARISSVEDEGIVLEEYELVAAPVSRIRPRRGNLDLWLVICSWLLLPLYSR